MVVIALFQTIAITSAALVSEEWYVGMTPSKTTVVNGTLVGYIMLSIIIILGVVLEIPLDRTLVSTARPFVQLY
jgi:hypothetical protein